MDNEISLIEYCSPCETAPDDIQLKNIFLMTYVPHMGQLVDDG